MALNANDAVGFEQRIDAAGHHLHDARAPLLHGGKVQFDAAGLDAVHREFFLGAMKQLGRFQQCLGRDAPGIQASAAEGIRAVEILPLVNAGHSELVLRSADGGRVAGRTTADDHHVKGVVDHCAHSDNTRRAGSSKDCFTATRNCTASRPSMMRWS